MTSQAMTSCVTLQQCFDNVPKPDSSPGLLPLSAASRLLFLHTIHCCPIVSTSTLWMPHAELWIRGCFTVALQVMAHSRGRGVSWLKNSPKNNDGGNPVPLSYTNCFWKVDSVQIDDAIINSCTVSYWSYLIPAAVQTEISIQRDPTCYVSCLNRQKTPHCVFISSQDVSPEQAPQTAVLEATWTLQQPPNSGKISTRNNSKLSTWNFSLWQI